MRQIMWLSGGRTFQGVLAVYSKRSELRMNKIGRGRCGHRDQLNKDPKTIIRTVAFMPNEMCSY